MAADTVPPLIAAQLNYLLTHSPLSIKVDQMWSGGKNHNFLDRFTLLIPFCLDYIRWDVIYNAQYPLAAPDIIFGPDDENFHPFHVAGEGEGDAKSPKNSLSDWNNKDPSRLLSLIHELREHYMSYQRKRVGEVDDDRLKFEVSTIISREGIEMCMNSGVEKSEEVKFAVPLMDLDINKMVLGCPWRHQQKIHLQVIFPVGRKYLSVPPAPRLKLVSSSELKALFSIEDVKLPPWLDGMCMAGYLPNLEETLEEQVVEAVSFIDVRRRFIEALAPLFGRPVEADPIFCRKATFLAASGVFTFLVHFFLPTQFPKQQPALMLQSSQHFSTQGIPIKSSQMADYPWSPRWELSQMAERVFEFLADESLIFKKYCNESQLQQH
ncbi:hypothetical protein L1049_026396 [Liquidambar formosana]|uniref:BRISC and BRCA1-A complex member 2 n=1 Tax=Liquidambar formosana TaxID=63359 RepID=A0AAP0R6D7_LIQFO